MPRFAPRSQVPLPPAAGRGPQPPLTGLFPPAPGSGLTGLFPPAPGTGTAVDPITTGGIGGGTANFTVGGSTLQALRERQQRLQETAPQLPSVQGMQSPWQGAAYLANTLVNSLQQNAAATAEQRGTQAMMNVFGQIDPLKGATPEQLAQIGQYDPEMAIKLWTDRAKRLNMETWSDIPTPPGETGQWQQSSLTGEKKRLGTTLTGPPAETEWAKSNAQALSKQLDATAGEGMDARGKLQQVDALENIMGSIGNVGPLEKGAIEYFQKNWGVSLNEKADKIQAFNAIVSSLLPQQKVPGMGTLSDSDINMFRTSLPALMGTAKGNAMIVKYMRGLAQYKAQLGDLAVQAQGIQNPVEARNFFFDNSKKLANPLADFQKELAGIGGGGGTEPPPAAAGGGGGGGTEPPPPTAVESDPQAAAAKQHYLDGGGSEAGWAILKKSGGWKTFVPGGFK
jgi:hypothetical protein